MTIQDYSLPEMVDLALSTPIIGVVNFGILRNLLHILIKETGLENFRSKLNITDMKPKKVEMPTVPRQPSDIAESIEEELKKLEEMQELDEIPIMEKISVSSPSIEENTNYILEEEMLEEARSDIIIENEENESIIVPDRKSKKSEIFKRSSSEVFQEPATFQEDMTEFWKLTLINSRITALEGGLEKIIDIIDEQARDLEHFRRDTERRRGKDNTMLKNMQTNLEELCQVKNSIISKVDECVSKKDYQTTSVEYNKYISEINNQLHDFDEQLLELSEKIEGDFKMQEIIDDINDIKEILKIAQKRTDQTFKSENIESDNYSVDINQVSGGANEFDSNQMKIIVIEEKLQKITEAIRELQSNKTEENIIEKETILENFNSYINESKEKLSNHQELFNEINKKIHDISATIVEIEKLQDDMLEEGRKNMQEIAENLQEIFQQLKKLSLIEDIQFRVEEVRNCKVDRSEMYDRLDRKADISLLEEKLDKSTYLESCKETNSEFANITAKFAAQEQQTERTFQKVTILLNQKFDRSEMDTHREILKDRLKIIASNLKQLRQYVEEEHSAAGIKIRCISCDRPLKKFNKDVVVSDGNKNPSLRFTTDIPRENGGFLPLLNKETANEKFHTVKIPPLNMKNAPAVLSQTNKEWEEVPLQGTDGRVYRGYLEKVTYNPSA